MGLALGSLRARASAVTWLLLAATLLLGLAQIAVLPPWEGFDETAHWSYLQQLSDTGHGPVYGGDRLSADLQAYPGPMPYGLDSADRTYRSFRASGAHQLAGGPTRFRGAGVFNWQAQHPPLFYTLLSPLYRAVHDLDWVDHLRVLRTACWLMAWSGWAIAVIATLSVCDFSQTQEMAELFGPWTAPLMALWPLLFAEFFPDLARLGNDSLCLLLVGVAWALLLRLVPARRPRPLWALGLGLVLGAGFWTKAFFVPITLGIAVLLAARARRDRGVGQALDAVIAGVVPMLIGGAWYLLKLRQTGSFSGSDETIQLVRAGGLMHGLAAHFRAGEVVRGLAGVVQSLPWVGTWSLGRMPSLLIYSAALVGVIPLMGYLRRLRNLPLVGWTPIALAAPMLLGLFHHILVRIALDGSGLGTPGWYLHIVAPALAFALALGWEARRLSAVLAAYAMTYGLAAQAWQLSMYSGCAGLGEARHFTLNGADCFIDQRALNALGRPAAAAVCLILALALALAAFAVARPWRRVMAEASVTPA